MSLELNLADDDDDQADAGTERYEAYTDYSKISTAKVGIVQDAIHAINEIDSAHHEGTKVRSQPAARARADVLDAMIALTPELRTNRDADDDLDDILNRWEGSDGYRRRLKAVHLTRENPEWLSQLADDISHAAWQLGYTRSGKTTRENDVDPVEKESDNMLSE